MCPRVGASYCICVVMKGRLYVAISVRGGKVCCMVERQHASVCVCK